MDEKKKNFEEWLQDREQPKLPYVVLCGSIDNITQSLVVINGKNFIFSNSILAVEFCYKSLTALHCFPYTCDHVWAAITELVYGQYKFNPHVTKIPKSATKFAVEVNKIDYVQDPVDFPKLMSRF